MNPRKFFNLHLSKFLRRACLLCSILAANTAVAQNPANALSNLSVRTAMASGQTIIVGAVANGPKNILVRAAGPALSSFGLGGMVDPRLELYASNNLLLAANDDWNPASASVFSSVGAFPFPLGSKDSALNQSVSGSFTVQARGAGPGTLLIELYDASGGTASRLVNISTRSKVGTGSDILIAGFNLAGRGTRPLLIRGIGPGLSPFGVTGLLSDPTLQVFDDANRLVASNDNWNASLASTFTSLGAFGLPENSKDSALLVTLNAGAAYTVWLSGAGGGVGEALLEIYEMPNLVGNGSTDIAAGDKEPPSPANGYTGLVADVLQIQQFPPNPRSDEEWYRTDRTLVVDHKNPEILYISVEYRGIFKSLDGGKTWQQKTKGIKVYARTDDKTKGAYGEYPVIKMNPANPLHLVAGLSGPGGGFLHPDLPNSQVGGVYQTLDGGENWQLMITDKMNVYVTDVAFDPVNPDTIYYSTASNPASWGGADQAKLYVEKGLIYKTTDRGKTWVELPTGIGQNSSVSNILINPLQTNQINAPTFSAGRQSADGSGTGVSTGKDTTVPQLGVLTSANGGTTWESLKSTDNPPLRKGFASANNWQFQYFVPSQTASSGQPKGLFSGDGGKTFTPTSYLDIVTYDPFDRTGQHAIGYSTVLWTPSDAKFTLYESFDGGKSWQPLGKLPIEIVNPNFVKTRPSSIVWGPQNKHTIYMSGAGGLVWKSTDLGTSWTKLLDYTQLPL